MNQLGRADPGGETGGPTLQASVPDIEMAEEVWEMVWGIATLG